MGLSQSKKNRVKINLNVNGEIVLTKEVDFNILCFEINFNSYFPIPVPLWPQNLLPIPSTTAVSSEDNGCFD